MVELDGDDIRISSRGKLAERDIVQVTFFYGSMRNIKTRDRKISAGAKMTDFLGRSQNIPAPAMFR